MLLGSISGIRSRFWVIFVLRKHTSSISHITSSRHQKQISKPESIFFTSWAHEAHDRIAFFGSINSAGNYWLPQLLHYLTSTLTLRRSDGASSVHQQHSLGQDGLVVQRGWQKFDSKKHIAIYLMQICTCNLRRLKGKLCWVILLVEPFTLYLSTMFRAWSISSFNIPFFLAICELIDMGRIDSLLPTWNHSPGPTMPQPQRQWHDVCFFVQRCSRQNLSNRLSL